MKVFVIQVVDYSFVMIMSGGNDEIIVGSVTYKPMGTEADAPAC